MTQAQQPEALPSLEEFISQIQCFASAWSLVDGKFDDGTGREVANAEKAITSDMARRLYAHLADLEAQLAAIGAGGVEPLRKQCMHQNAEPVAASTVPAGWRLVPVKPTQEMANAAKWVDGRLSVWKYAEVYAAMLANTPQPPEAQAEEARDAALKEIIGCFDAANAEGLDDALVNNTDARLANLVQRRLLHAGYVAIAALAAKGEKP